MVRYKLGLGQPKPICISPVEFEYEEVTPHTLTKFLFDIHYVQGLVPSRPFDSYLREASQLQKEMINVEIIKTMQGAISDYPFSFQYIRRLMKKDNKYVVYLFLREDHKKQLGYRRGLKLDGKIMPGFDGLDLKTDEGKLQLFRLVERDLAGGVPHGFLTLDEYDVKVRKEGTAVLPRQ